MTYRHRSVPTAAFRFKGCDADLQTVTKLEPMNRRPAGIVPVRLKPDVNRDLVEASRTQYNAMDMRRFANGRRSVLDFFRALEQTGEFELTQS